MKIQPQELRASELRIGNYVQHELYGIQAVDATEIKNQHQCDLAKRIYFKPIPITEDILLKAGFEDVGTGSPYLEISNNTRIVFPIKNTDKVAYLQIDYDGDYSLGFPDGSVDCYTNIKHLHQLQNLYYVLTGEELTINLKDNPTP